MILHADALIAVCPSVRAGSGSGFRTGHTTFCLSLHFCHHKGQLRGPVQAQCAGVGSDGLQLWHLCWAQRLLLQPAQHGPHSKTQVTRLVLAFINSPLFNFLTTFLP